MMRKTVLTLVAAASLIAAAAALAPSPLMTTTGSKHPPGYGNHQAHDMAGSSLRECPHEMIECGLVVW